MSRALPIVALVTAAVFARMAWLTETRIKAQDGPDIFDIRYGYGMAEAEAILLSLSDAALQTYLGPMRTLDTLFPLLLTATLILALLWIARPWNLWSRLVLCVPAAGYAVMDLAENTLVAEILRGGVEGLAEAPVALASQFTMMKWNLLAASVAILAGAALLRLRAR